MWLCGFFPSIVVIVPYLLPYEWGVMPVALYKPTKDRENLEREVQQLREEKIYQDAVIMNMKKQLNLDWFWKRLIFSSFDWILLEWLKLIPSATDSKLST